MLFIHIHVQPASDDEGAFEVDIADVCDFELAMSRLSVDDGVFQNKAGPIAIVGVAGRLQDGGLGHVFDMT